MRVATDFWVPDEGPDPRGMDVVGVDGELAGRVRDIWVDRAEPQARYLEVAVPSGGGGEGGGAERNVLLPTTLIRVDSARGRVKVASITADQFTRVPQLRDPDQVTLLEEDRICAYYAGGHLYAVPSRREALL